MAQDQETRPIAGRHSTSVGYTTLRRGSDRGERPRIVWTASRAVMIVIVVISLASALASLATLGLYLANH